MSATRTMLLLLLASACTSPTSSSVMASPAVHRDGSPVSGAGGGAGGGGVTAPGKYLLKLTGFGSFKGKTVRLKVNGEKTSATIDDSGGTTVGGTAVEIGQTYTADFFVDFNGDGACAPCATDTEPAWRRTVTGGGETDTFTFETQWTDISPF